jgi:hypothetical protein
MEHAKQLQAIETPDQHISPYFDADSVSNLGDIIEAKLGECFECSSFKDILHCPHDIVIGM